LQNIHYSPDLLALTSAILNEILLTYIRLEVTKIECKVRCSSLVDIHSMQSAILFYHVRLSVRPSNDGIVSKPTHLSSHFLTLW